MVVNQVLLLLLKPQPYVPAKTFATNCIYSRCAGVSVYIQLNSGAAGCIVSSTTRTKWLHSGHSATFPSYISTALQCDVIAFQVINVHMLEDQYLLVEDLAAACGTVWVEQLAEDVAFVGFYKASLERGHQKIAWQRIGMESKDA